MNPKRFSSRHAGWSVILCLVACLLTVCFANDSRAQAPRTITDILPALVTLPEWGLKDASEIQAGSIGVLHEKNDRLEVYRLRKIPPVKKAPEGYISKTPSFKEGFFLVADFDSGNQNSLGGYFNVYKRHPSTALAGLERAPDGRRALTIHYDRASEGFCGVWMHFYNLKLEPEKRIYFNAEPFAYLTFWIRGGAGGEPVYLKISDAEWDRKEDALPVGFVSDYIASGRIDTAWQLVKIPMASLPERIKRAELAGMILDIPERANGHVQVKAIAFVTEKGKPPGLPKLPARETPSKEGMELATWVWETTRILGSPSDQDELLKFLRDQRINHLFLQIPNEPDKVEPDGGTRIEAEKLRPFLRKLNAQGVKVHALDGWKNFALPEYHEGILATVRNVIAYNRASKPAERFYGFHYDIEPYLLSGFGGPRQDWILKNYLLINKRAHALAREAGMVYGLDIPFWFDAPDDFTNEFFIVEFDGKRKFVSEHVIDMMDNVGIMDYRTTAYGADGIIAHASGELEYATRTKQKKIFIGLETYALPDETMWMFRTGPQTGWPILASGIFLFAAPASDTTAMFYFVPGQKLGEFEKRMEAGKTPKEKLIYWRLRENIFIPGSKITFAGMAAARLADAVDQTRFEMADDYGFYGFAIHYYETYRDILKESNRPAGP